MIAVFLVLCMCLVFSTSAGADTANLSQPVDYDPCMGEKGYRESWIDRTHAYLTKKICEPAVWFDNFFGDKRTIDEGRPTSNIRWRNDFRWIEADGVTYRNRIRINLRLPRLSQRLRFIIAGENEEDELDPVFDRGLTRDEDDDDDRLFAGLSYDLRDTSRYKLSLGGGIKISSSLDPFVRLRYRYTYPLGRYSLARLTQTVFWRNDDGFGERTRIDLERMLTPVSMVRWSSSGLYSEESDGLEWDTGMTLFYQLSPKRAASGGFGMAGITDPNRIVETYAVNLRYRQNIFRPWFFYELRPGVSWPKDDDWNAELSFVLRIEIYFERKAEL